MFRKASLLLCLLVLSSCVTDAVESERKNAVKEMPAPVADIPEHKNVESEQQTTGGGTEEDGTEEDGTEEDEQKLLLWCEPDDKIFNEKTFPLPEVVYQPVISEEAAEGDVTVSETVLRDAEEPSAADADSDQSTETLTVSVVKKKAPSFLEAILNPKIEPSGSAPEEVSETPEATESSESTLPTLSPEPAGPERTVAADPLDPVQQEKQPVKIEPEILILNRYTEVHEIYMEEVDGEGWILESYDPLNDENDEMLKYKGREYLNGNTVFSFYPIKTGAYIILLRRTDFTTGTIERQRINLDVFSSIEEMSEEDESVNIEKPVVEASERLPEQEEPPAPLPLDTAGLKEAAAGLEAAGDCRGAADLIRKNIVGVDWSEKDYFYFLLGRLYESCSRIRDERLAAEYYQKVIDLYPVSIYWIESRERIAYLERNFIYIR